MERHSMPYIPLIDCVDGTTLYTYTDSLCDENEQDQYESPIEMGRWRYAPHRRDDRRSQNCYSTV